jgi:hypothetical protein
MLISLFRTADPGAPFTKSAVRDWGLNGAAQVGMDHRQGDCLEAPWAEIAGFSQNRECAVTRAGLVGSSDTGVTGRNERSAAQRRLGTENK